MALQLDSSVLSERWERWLTERNTAGARVALFLVATLYPGFAILDWIVVRDSHVLAVLLTIRAAVLAITLTLFGLLRTQFFRSHWRWLTPIYMLLCSVGIAAMVAALGGFRSPYYAGLNLVMVGSGLLYVWPYPGIAIMHGGTVAVYIVACVLVSQLDASGVSNLFFLGSTAIIVSAGQVLNYQSQRRQVMLQLMVEIAKKNLEEAHEKLKALDRFRSRVFANITHELKTPLSLILSPLDLMLQGQLGAFSEEQKATLRSMFRSGIKLLKLIGDILDLTKIEDARVRLNIAEHDLAFYLRALVAQVKPLTDRKGIALEFRSELASAPIWCDLERVERVFVNLLSNAAKFTPEGGKILVTLEDEGTSVLASVVDNGPGFPPQYAERIFERFFQVDMGSARRFGGTGIGLALAKELVELHGGRIWAESQPGQGAAFHVRFFKGREHFNPEVLERRVQKRDIPDGRRAEDRGIVDWTETLVSREEYRFLDIAEATERRVVERDSNEFERRWTVLVVEDNVDVIRLVHLTLRQQFKIMAAENGVKGFEIATRERPDLIITDLMMPEVDGLELTRRLRADPRTKHIPIIMLTARGDLEDRVAGIETGVNQYLTKPFSPRELLAAVQNLLNIEETHADLLLTQRMDALEQMAGGLAHEINNPLNYVKNALYVMRNDVEQILQWVRRSDTSVADVQTLAKVERRIAKMAETAEAGLSRIARTVELMRSYSREGYTRTLRPHDTFAAIKEVISVVVPAIGKDVVVETDLVGDGTVECVPEEINQVFTNLIQNAVEAVPDDGTGRVFVTGREANGRVVITVRDNGPGIPPEFRDRIFAPFFTTKGPGKGMGMGLTIAWRVVQSLGGHIKVTSERGRGAEFEVVLPKGSRNRVKPN